MDNFHENCGNDPSQAIPTSNLLKIIKDKGYTTNQLKKQGSYTKVPI